MGSPGVTKSMEQSPSYKAHRTSASQDIPYILQNPKKGSLPFSKEGIAALAT
jgi:hypothetical protein